MYCNKFLIFIFTRICVEIYMKLKFDELKKIIKSNHLEKKFN